MNKRQFNLTSAILRGQWAIDPMYAMQHLPLVERMLAGETVSFFGDDDEKEPDTIASLYVLDGGSWRAATAQDPNSLTGVQYMSIAGPMMKHGSCGSLGTADYADALHAAYRDKRVSATLIGWDTPGGQLDGTPTLHDAIQNPAKPTVSLVTDGMMASAGYWGAAPSDKIFASQATDIVGSIGVYTTLRDVRQYYEKMGVKVTDVYSSLSSQKNIEYRKALEGDLAPLIARLDRSANVFIKTVTAARGTKLNSKDWKNGGTYAADEALKMGLIDGMSTFEDALNMAADMAKTRKQKSFSPTQNTNTKPNMSLVNKAKAFLLGASATDDADPSAHRDAALEALAQVAEERQTRITTLETELATARQSLATATAAQTVAQTRITELEGQNTTLTTERDTARAEAAAFGNQPGAAPTSKGTAKKVEGEGGTPSAKDLTANNSMNQMAAVFGL